MIAWLLSSVLVLLSALHLLWAIGYWFPIADEAALARAVVGRPEVRRMPGAVPCALVVVALFFAAAVPLFPPSPFRVVALGGLAAVFLARGIAAYLPAWRRLLPEQPFARLDRMVYGPLCLLLGAGFATIFMEAAR